MMLPPKEIRIFMRSLDDAVLIEASLLLANGLMLASQFA
jgi:hypothetical protein